MFNFLFKKEPTEAQLKTAWILASKVYQNLYGHTKPVAEKLAYKSVMTWIDNDTIDIALKQLWKAKIA